MVSGSREDRATRNVIGFLCFDTHPCDTKTTHSLTLAEYAQLDQNINY